MTRLALRGVRHGRFVRTTVSHEELGYFYQAADLYVSPTLQEGFGRTVIKAQIVGIPVVASDLPVCR